MARWRSGADERLKQAALGLFTEQGFDRTTVAEIAAAAGVTERTFFRHFTDKREVLFFDQAAFEQVFVVGLGQAAGNDPMALVTAALRAGATLFPEERRDWARARQRVIAAHEALTERELLKMASLALALTGALVGRGVDAMTAALAAETGVTVFRTAFAGWIAAGEQRPFAEIQRGVLDKLQGLLTA